MSDWRSPYFSDKGFCTYALSDNINITILRRSSSQSSAVFVLFKQELEWMESTVFHKFCLVGGQTLPAEERTDETNIRHY